MIKNNREKIIMVDDNVVNLAIGKGILSPEYEVLALPSGEKLFIILERIKPDLILLDIDMPEMDGFDIIKMLKKEDKTAQIPVIFLTARTDAESEHTGLLLGASDYIVKPYTAAYLREKVRDCLSCFDTEMQDA